jgi:hopanoid biosynthesis associated RND transporter like protein HpnN
MPPVSPSEPTPAPDRLARVVAAVVARVVRRPWLVLAGCLALTAVSVHLAVTRLEYHTQRNDLLGAEKECQKRWQKYLDAFGEDDDMVVVAEGTDRDRMKAALDAVAGRVKARPDLFDRVFHRVDLRTIHDRAVLLLPLDQLEGVRGRVERMEPLLGPLAPLAWQRLNLQSLLGTAVSTLDARAAGRSLNPSDEDLLAQLPAVAHAAAAALRDPAGYHNPWAVAGSRTADRNDERQLTDPQYFFTADGTLAMLVCRPKMATRSFTPAREANDAMRAILAETGPGFPGVTLGLTGLPVLETDEMVRSDVDSRRASGLALFGVAVLYFVVYRGFRYPLLTIACLLTGTAWALGWATVTVGHLNILSATFAVMLIGMGDYGVLWVARYDEARRAGACVAGAMRSTAEHAGPSILTAAVTTALAFFATMLVDFRAVSELGWIAGSGVLFCAAACLTLMPAALTIVERRRAGGDSPLSPPGGEPAVGRTGGLTPPARPDVLAFPSPSAAWLPGLAGRPRAVLAAGVLLLLGCGAFAGRLTYDHNLLHLQPHDLDSVVWERKLIDRAAGLTWDAMSVAHTREEAVALRARYEALPEVGRVIEVASLVPADQEAKLPAVRAIHERLRALLPADRVPAVSVSSAERVRELAARVRQAAGDDAVLSGAMADLLGGLDAASADAAGRLAAFDRRLAADLAADLNRLKAVCHPDPITLADLPAELRERYVGANGEFLVRAFAKDSLWDYDTLRGFTAAAATADPVATGKAFRTLEGLRQMKVGFEWAGVYALAAIVLVLLLDLRRLTDLGLVLFPLAVGVVLTLGVMGLCGVPLNPANMIALPLIIGVGVDNGVHVLHDYRERRRGVAYRLGAATGRGVLVAALTTVLGFGTLMTARHVGMASLGLALALGVTFCMVAALVWLPAVLRLLDERPSRRDPVTIPLDRPAAKAA